MKRFKAKNKPRNPQKELIRKSSYEAVEFLTTMTEIVLRDDFKFTNSEVDKFKTKLNRYCGYVAKGTVSYIEIQKIIRRKKDENKER